MHLSGIQATLPPARWLPYTASMYIGGGECVGDALSEQTIDLTLIQPPMVPRVCPHKRIYLHTT